MFTSLLARLTFLFDNLFEDIGHMLPLHNINLIMLHYKDSKNCILLLHDDWIFTSYLEVRRLSYES
jgi:hypothetical protein